MLNVKIKETGDTETLSLIDPKTGCNYIADFIGNTGAFYREFERIEDENGTYYLITQDDYDWWSNVIAMQEKSDVLQVEFLENHSYDDLLELLSKADYNDLDTRLENEIELLTQAL